VGTEVANSVKIELNVQRFCKISFWYVYNLLNIDTLGGICHGVLSVKCPSTPANMYVALKAIYA